MKKIIIFLFLLFVIGCTTEFITSSITLTTDKNLYHSNEVMKITANINSPVELNNATIRFYGIYASRYRLDKTKTVNLQKGQNIVTLEYNAPSCFGCSGIKPGTYKINADIIHNKETLANSSVDIEIRQ